MAQIETTIRKIGNGRGVLLPKVLWDQIGAGVGTKLEVEVDSTSKLIRLRNAGTVAADCALAAMEFALKTDEGLEFLRCWMHGDFAVIRREWPEAPSSVFEGADPTVGAKNGDSSD